MSKLKLWFADFWPHFYYDNNYFYHLLKTAYDVELDEENPDILFLSCDPYQNQERLKYKDKDTKRVFYSMEGIPAKLDEETSYPPSVSVRTTKGTQTTYISNPLSDLTGDSEDSNRIKYYYSKCDFALTHDVTSDTRHKRLPYWAYQIDWFDKASYNAEYQGYDVSYGEPALLISESAINDNEYKNTAKTKFCVSFFNNPIDNRVEAHEKLNSYKNVDGYGEYFGNGFYPWEKTKLDLSKDYKFILCFENKSRQGYHTEKLFHAKIAGAVPIYWGHSSVSNDFNTKAFINLNDYSSIDELVEYIKRVDQDDALYNSYLQEPLFTNNTIADEFKPASVLSFFQNTVLA